MNMSKLPANVDDWSIEQWIELAKAAAVNHQFTEAHAFSSIARTLLMAEYFPKFDKPPFIIANQELAEAELTEYRQRWVDPQEEPAERTDQFVATVYEVPDDSAHLWQEEPSYQYSQHVWRIDPTDPRWTWNKCNGLCPYDHNEEGVPAHHRLAQTSSERWLEYGVRPLIDGE
jgi:hypothetical protein